MVDSGAAEHVANPDAFPGIEVEESEGSKSGLNYVAANGDPIPNLGEQKVKVATEEGHLCGLKFQSADVTRPILSVPKLTESGHECTFRKRKGSSTTSTQVRGRDSTRREESTSWGCG